MDEPRRQDPRQGRHGFVQQVGKKAERRDRRRRQRDEGIWHWLGMFGLVGWAVAIPTLAGIALGWWIDRSWPGDASWTLNLLIVGVILGCWNAWHWIMREGRED